ncbi:unnamed protein product, partial [Linum tenue]
KRGTLLRPNPCENHTPYRCRTLHQTSKIHLRWVDSINNKSSSGSPTMVTEHNTIIFKLIHQYPTL